MTGLTFINPNLTKPLIYVYETFLQHQPRYKYNVIVTIEQSDALLPTSPSINIELITCRRRVLCLHNNTCGCIRPVLDEQLYKITPSPS